MLQWEVGQGVSGVLALCSVGPTPVFSKRALSPSAPGRTAGGASADSSISFMVQEEMKRLIPKVFASSV